ncbi:two-component sensor histidine kinase [Paenibacillus pectinilyticus]|uniref:Heme sensor protein HssS n=1 Tax=Paenibacillus pectinilyticus TaxID=512399 RepID=A0A1C1A0H6_9BACL|nr:two-component sensor histidine kinase [Paenibacillus pectinilyticus]
MKSLYVRIILTFVGAVIISLILSFYIISLIYQRQLNDLVTDNLIANGKKIIQTYQTTPSAQLQPFMQNVSGISNTSIQIYDHNGDAILNQNNLFIQVKPNSIQSVVAGNVFREVDVGKEHQVFTGLPFQSNGESYALFLTLDSGKLEHVFSYVVQTLLLSVLILGSLLILIAARFIVKPIKRLTQATKRMAKGIFDIQLPSNRRDEIGQLTASFNEMAIELANLDRMRQEFVTNVSHEFQTPLTSITGFTKALKHKAMSEESRLHYLTIIEEESKRLSRLSQNLLQLSHLQHKDSPLKPSMYRLDEQLRNVMITLEPQWAGKQIALDIEFEQIQIEAEEDQLNQVWVNLLSNSIKFTPAAGKIQVSAVIQGKLVFVTFSDNGPGIPEDLRSSIFMPFYKVDKSRNSSIQGNGLGLSIVKPIVDSHHGEILVSTSVWGGSSFTVQLPLRHVVERNPI